MKQIYTVREIAKEAISTFNITSGDKVSLLDKNSKKISRYLEKTYGKKETIITEEIRTEIFSWDGLYEYFKAQTDNDWKGKKYYDALTYKKNHNRENWISEQISQIGAECEANQDLEKEIVSAKNRLRDEIMFKIFLESEDPNYKEGYKIITQNSFDTDFLEFTKKTFFNKYFDEETFTNDFLQYWLMYDDPFNVRIDAHMVEAEERLKIPKNYLIFNSKNKQ